VEDLKKILKEEQKRNPKYFKGSVEDKGDSFEITLSPFYKDLLKIIMEDKKK
tara:strand:+ start:435 stop:590 length:156 start_codon:yes stop_codon:yes gene_type:complete